MIVLALLPQVDSCAKNEMFLRADDMFTSQTKVNKEVGLGEIESYPHINDADLILAVDYFNKNILVNFCCLDCMADHQKLNVIQK